MITIMGNRKKRFEFLEHTADLYIAAYGETLKKSFENAAAAMFEGMTDLKSVKPQVEDKVEVEGFDEPALLYNWLEALLLKFDVDDMLYSRFKIVELRKNESGFKLKAHVWGEPFDSNKHVSKVGIKAVTYHRMEILKKPKRAVVKFILDI